MTIAPLPPDLAGRDWTLYQPDPLGRLGRGTWGRRPEPAPEEDDPDPDVNRLRRMWRQVRDFGPLDDYLLRLDDGVGRHQPNRRADVAKVEAALHRAGLYDVSDTDGPTGYFGPPQEAAIKTFQQKAGLTVDGWLGRDGETVQALAAAQPQTFRPAPGRKASLLADDGEPVIEQARINSRDLPGARDPLGLDNPLGSGGGGGGYHAGAKAGGTLLEGLRQLPEGSLTAPMEPAHPPLPRRWLPAHDADAMTQPEPELQMSPALPPPNPNQPRVLPLASEDGGEPRTIGDYMANGIAEVMVHPWGPHGNLTTRQGNDIVARECLKVINGEFGEGVTGTHAAGGSPNGQGGPQQKEETIPTPQGKKVYRRPDLTFEIVDAEGTRHLYRFNTADVYADGSLKPHEAQALDDLKHRLGQDLANAMPKLKPGDDIDEYTKLARAKCRELFKSYLR